MVARKLDVVVNKCGGAPLDAGAAYRHAVAIVKGRPGAPVVVVSAPAGITDILLGLATRAVAGEKGGKIGRDVGTLRARYQKIARDAAGAGKGSAVAGVASEIDRSMD